VPPQKAPTAVINEREILTVMRQDTSPRSVMTSQAAAAAAALRESSITSGSDDELINVSRGVTSSTTADGDALPSAEKDEEG